MVRIVTHFSEPTNTNTTFQVFKNKGSENFNGKTDLSISLCPQKKKPLISRIKDNKKMFIKIEDIHKSVDFYRCSSKTWLYKTIESTMTAIKTYPSAINKNHSKRRCFSKLFIIFNQKEFNVLQKKFPTAITKRSLSSQTVCMDLKIVKLEQYPLNNCLSDSHCD